MVRCVADVCVDRRLAERRPSPSLTPHILSEWREQVPLGTGAAVCSGSWRAGHVER